MGIVILETKISNSDLGVVKEDYGEYVKVVVDVRQKLLAAGGEWHADGEKVLLERGSSQDDLWGGGIDLSSGKLDFTSLINTRPRLNNSEEVIDADTREKMAEVTKKVFGEYVK